MSILPQLLDGPWSSRPRVDDLAIGRQLAVPVLGRAKDMARTIKALREDPVRAGRARLNVDSRGGTNADTTD